MDKVFSTAYNANKPSENLRGDFTDKLHSRFTVGVFLFVLVLIVTRQYQGDAIACWLPQQFSGDQTSYIHQLCWVNNTYYYPDQMHDADKFGDDPSNKYGIHYYQFVLFILSGQIMLFYLPSVLWKIVSSDSGAYINKILDSVDRTKIFKNELSNIEDNVTPKFPLRAEHSSGSPTLNESTASEVSFGDLEKRGFLSNKVSDGFLGGFNDLVDFKKPKFNSLISTSSKKGSLKKVSHSDAQTVDLEPIQSQEYLNVEPTKPHKKSIFKKMFKRPQKLAIKPIKGVQNMAFYYFSMKIFNLANVVAQFLALRYIFGADFWRYGYDFFGKILNAENPLWMSKQFPIVTICDYYVHQNLRRIHWNSSQCLLAINVLIEKFYVLIWMWLIVLIFVTFFNILSWVMEMKRSTAVGFLMKYLSIKERMNLKWIEKEHEVSVIGESALNKKNVEAFYLETLGRDGLVMMHIVRAISGDMIFIDLLNSLWLDFKHRKLE